MFFRNYVGLNCSTVYASKNVEIYAIYLALHELYSSILAF